MKDSREEVSIWLKRKLDSHYLVFYIDATFVHTRRDKSVSKECYYTILGIKEDGSREVLSVVNHPTEGALLWQQELDSLKERGVQSIGLVVSDGLTSIENAIAMSFADDLLLLILISHIFFVMGFECGLLIVNCWLLVVYKVNKYPF